MLFCALVDNIYANARDMHQEGKALDKALFFNQKLSIFFLFLDKNICYGTY